MVIRDKQDELTQWLFFCGLRHYLGVAVNEALRQEFMRWMADNGWPNTCDICGERVARRDRSLDHIIPKSVCYELGLAGLVLDSRNFRLAHKRCNGKRGSNLSGLPEPILRRLAVLRELQ